MNRDEIICMAQEAGIMPPGWGATENQWRSLHAFAALVSAAEREACAMTVEEWLHGEWHNQGIVAAMMIRARGQS